MSEMFQGAASFNRDLSNWKTGNVTSMEGMFNGAGMFNQPIGSWNTENVTNMVQMFRGAVLFNQDLSGWNVRNLNTCPDKPFEFDLGADFWIEPRPEWSICK
jgi:surface protein